MRLTTALRVVWLVCLVGGVAWTRVLAHQSGAGADGPLYLAYGSVVPAAYLVPGVILLLRRRWHAVGQLLCLFAVGVGFAFASDWGNQRFGGAWMVWLLDVYEGSLFWLPVVALLVVFPDGLSAQTPRQRRVGRTVLAVAAAVAELFVAEVRLAGGELVPSPLSIAFLPTAVKDDVTITIEFAALVVAFAGMVVRYRSSHAAARRQYRWVLSAIVALIVALLIGLVGSTIGGQDDGPWWFPILFAYLALPVAFMARADTATVKLSDTLQLFGTNVALHAASLIVLVPTIRLAYQPPALGRPCAPSMQMLVPFTQLARSDRRNVTTSATWSALPSLPAGKADSSNSLKRSGSRERN